LNVDIVSKNENKLMDRTEVTFKASHSGEATPARDAVRTSLAGSLKVPKERVVISEMQSEFGQGASHGAAKVYGSAESAAKYERNHILVRNGLAQKKVKVKAAPAPKKRK